MAINRRVQDLCRKEGGGGGWVVLVDVWDEVNSDRKEVVREKQNPCKQCRKGNTRYSVR